MVGSASAAVPERLTAAGVAPRSSCEEKTPMRRTLVTAALLVFAVSSREARGQWGGFGGRGQGMGGGGLGREAPPAPRLPGAELDGPPDSATAQTVLDLSDQQAARYAQVYDSFMTATRPQRDSARATTQTMNDRLDSGDRAAAMFYAERLQELGKYLKDRQDKFEDNLRRILTGDQVKRYRRWKEDQERTAEEKVREDALRWRQAALGGDRMAALPEPRTFIASPAGTPRPDLGSQAVPAGPSVHGFGHLPPGNAGALGGAREPGVQAPRAVADGQGRDGSSRLAPTRGDEAAGLAEERVPQVVAARVPVHPRHAGVVPHRARAQERDGERRGLDRARPLVSRARRFEDLEPL